MDDREKQILAITLENWKHLSSTEAFLRNLERKRQEFLSQAEDISSSSCSDLQVRHLLIKSLAYREVINYARTDPESIA